MLLLFCCWRLSVVFRTCLMVWLKYQICNHLHRRLNTSTKYYYNQLPVVPSIDLSIFLEHSALTRIWPPSVFFFGQIGNPLWKLQSPGFDFSSVALPDCSTFCPKGDPFSPEITKSIPFSFSLTKIHEKWFSFSPNFLQFSYFPIMDFLQI